MLLLLIVVQIRFIFCLNVALNQFLGLCECTNQIFDFDQIVKMFNMWPCKHIAKTRIYDFSHCILVHTHTHTSVELGQPSVPDYTETLCHEPELNNYE